MQVSYFFHHFQTIGPHRLSRLKEAALNNERLARVAVAYGLHAYLRVGSAQAAANIAYFVAQLEQEEGLTPPQAPGQQAGSHGSSAGSAASSSGGGAGVGVRGAAGERVGATYGRLGSRAPKELGDVVESLCGAVYVDCGQDLAVVWQVGCPVEWY